MRYTVDDSNPLLLIALFVLSAFFSGSETAFFSLSRIYLKKIENSSKGSSKRILALLKKPRHLLITLLLGNTFVNMAISSLAALWALKYSGLSNYLSPGSIITIQIVVTTLLLLIFSELIPKLIALATATIWSQTASLPLLVLNVIFYPLIWIFDRFGRMVSKKQRVDTHLGARFTSEEFQNLIHSEGSTRSLEEHEKRMIVGLFRFKEAEISEILVPRVKIVGIEENSSLEDLRDLILLSGFSRIPVYRESIDDIIGIVYVKDVLLYPDRKTIKELLRPAWFITENMKVQTLLNQFKSRKMQFAVVVDEYGGTSGIITLEDIMEEIVGDIRDEYDRDEVPEFFEKDDGTYIISGMYNIRQFNHEFSTNIDPDEYDNLAEFLLENFNHVPRVEEQFMLEDRILLTILEADEKSIISVKASFLYR